MYPHFRCIQRYDWEPSPEHWPPVAPVLWPDCQGSSQARRRTAWRSQPWWKIMSPQVTSLVEVACLCWLSLQVSESIYPDSWSLLVPPCSHVLSQQCPTLCHPPLSFPLVNRICAAQTTWAGSKCWTKLSQVGQKKGIKGFWCVGLCG